MQQRVGTNPKTANKYSNPANKYSKTADKYPRRVHKQFQPNHLNARIDTKSVDIPTVPSGEAEDNYSLSGLLTIKERLNAAKSKLDVYYLSSKQNPEERDRFQRFQNIIDIYKPMRFKVQKQYNAKIVTNAWLKYWELYSHYNVVPAKLNRKFIAFFNAELPGAALCAFNHFMKTERTSIQFDWRASSLAPGSTTTKNLTDALGDVYGLYQHNRDKWLMTLPGDSGKRQNNGDVTVLDNIKDFATVVGPDSEFGGVDLYSHDAGIDVSDDFNNQELSNAKIHLGCALSGFMTLRKGGTFIAKQYTFFETFTWNLILIYAQMFDEFYICKPLTSRPYNSEIYLVGKGFRGLPKNIETVLSERLVNFNTTPLIPRDATRVMLGDVASDVERFARIVFLQQAHTIEENVQLYETYKTKLDQLRFGLDALKAERSQAWFRKYKVGVISDQDQLPSN